MDLQGTEMSTYLAELIGIVPGYFESSLTAVRQRGVAADDRADAT